MPELPYFENLNLGQGCDSFIRKAHTGALDFEQPESTDSSFGISIDEASLEQITSSYELAQRLEVEVSASYGGFGFSASAAAKYVSSVDINRFNTFLLAKVKVTMAAQQIINPRLKIEAKQILSTRGWDGFEQVYGPEYVRGIISGGSYYGLIRISTQSRIEQEQIVARVSASGWGANLEAKLDFQLREVSQGRETNVQIFQVGGPEDETLETTIDEMILQFKNFPSTIQNNAKASKLIVDKYIDTIPDTQLIEIPGQAPLDRTNRNNVLRQLSNEYLKLKDYRSNLEYVINHILDFEKYQDLDEVALENKKDNLRADFETVSTRMNRIVERTRSCYESITSCELPTDIFQPRESLPEIDGQKMMLKQLEQEVYKLKQAITVSDSLNVGIKTDNPEFALEVNGNVTINDRIYSRQRMHIHGEELLYLLNKAGVIIGKEWGGNGNLQVQGNISVLNESHLAVNGGNVGIGKNNPQSKLDVNGEIRGKLWYSNEHELVVPSDAPRIHKKRLLHSSKCTAFITSVSGNFRGGGERVWVEIGSDGYWYLCGHSYQEGVRVRARCFGMP